MASKNRAFDTISRRDAEFARGAGDDFQHRPDRSAGRNEPIGEWLGIFGNPHNAAVAGNKDHVERNVSVVHPKGDRLILQEVEQHTVTFGKFLAKHQAARPLRFRGRQLNTERMHAAFADDVERRVARGVQRRTGEQHQGRGDEKISCITASGANRTGKAGLTFG
jgi:hypothetical protein